MLTPLAPRSLHRRHSTNRPRRPAPNLRRLLPAAIPRIQPATRPLEHTRVLNRRGIPIIGIHPRNNRRLVGNPDVGEGRVALVLRLAVAAGAVELADVAGEEVLDGDGAAAVVLQDLVRRAARAAAVYVGGARLLEEGRGVFADVGPPARGG